MTMVVIKMSLRLVQENRRGFFCGYLGEIGTSAAMAGFESYLSEIYGLFMQVHRNVIISFSKCKVELLKLWVLFSLSCLYFGNIKIS